jgi:hypothetical protein
MSASRSSRSRRRVVGALAPAAAFGILLLAASGAHAGGLRFTTENDILTGNPTRDDLYTFSVGLEVERAGFTWSLREDAFTDRGAGVRFDETYLDVSRRFALRRGWDVRLAAGVAHSGHGLLGERVQNAVHRMIDDDEVHLDYHGSSWHPHLEASAGRFVARGDSLELGPRFELASTPGLRHRVAAGIQASWRPSSALAIEAFAGARWADAELEPLEPHLAGVGAAARIGVVVAERWLLGWSINDQGDEREHWTIGWVVPTERLGPGRGR